MSDKRKASGEEGNLHVGHRKRMLELFQKNGLDAFSDVETLEFLLGYALARIDTNVIAHRLLNRFGNLSRVFDAPVELLTQVEGVGLRTASLIRLCAALWNRTEEVRLSNERYLRTTSEVGQYLVAKIGAYREERAFLLCLDNSCKVIVFREISRGGLNIVNLPFRKIVEVSLAYNAASIVLSHNHVGASAVPSLEDINYTKEAQKVLKQMDVILADHIIVSEHSFVSMRKSSMMQPVGPDAKDSL